VVTVADRESLHIKGPLIVHVIPCDGIGGVEVAARSMLTRPDEGYAFRLLPIAGRPLVQSPRLIASRYASADNPAAQIAALCTVLRLKPDVLICSLWRSVLVCLIAKLLRPRIRLVFFLHLDRPVHLPDRLLTWLGIRFADEIWADAEETLAARTLPIGKLKRVVSFVTERLSPATPDAPAAPCFVCWARIVPQKGIDRAIALIRLLVVRGIDARFDIYGPDGGAQESLQQQVDELGLAQYVRFRGPIDHATLAEIAAVNSFFVQLSYFEGMAMATVEAMQFGLVPVTTPAGQMMRYVSPETGVLVDPDALHVAADQIADLLADAATYRQLRAGAIAYWQSAPLYADHVGGYARALARSLPGGGRDR
jgi:glycosyltransferase involved in cell wall biosynthesis